jgi:hypothetical protein
MQSYPQFLIPIRDSIVPFLPSNQQESLLSCEGLYHHRCGSPFCPLCGNRGPYLKRRELLSVAGKLPTSQLRFGTFTVSDVPIEELRQTAKTINKSMKMMIAGIPSLAGSFTGLEISHGYGLTHAHVHTVFDTKPGYLSGRNFMSPQKWEEQWRQALPASLQTMRSASVVVKRVHDVKGLVRYVTNQHWYTGITDAEIQTTIAEIQELRSLPRYSAVGSLAVN